MCARLHRPHTTILHRSVEASGRKRYEWSRANLFDLIISRSVTPVQGLSAAKALCVWEGVEWRDEDKLYIQCPPLSVLSLINEIADGQAACILITHTQGHRRVMEAKRERRRERCRESVWKREIGCCVVLHGEEKMYLVSSGVKSN